MTKYNITKKRENVAKYSTLVSAQMMEQLRRQILEKIVIDQKYKDKNYSAKQLATELDTNTRYISAVISVKFHTNYTTFVNQLRIGDAMSLLIDKRFADLTMEEIGDMVGFSNRQSFYASFYKITGKSPRAYRKEHEERLGNKK